MPGGESPLTIRDVTSLYSILLLGTARYRSLVPYQVFYFFRRVAADDSCTVWVVIVTSHTRSVLLQGIYKSSFVGGHSICPRLYITMH